MSEHYEPRAEQVERTGEEVRSNWVQRRRDKIYNEISANRRGEYTVPTWVLAVLLGVFVAGWIALVVLK
ncbi:hypothetical protein Cme02nite_67340 [Catellatospora methionotrophica]|uniref:Uncharacterized protein n=1 Tax=Catellatospora methionotrophica TaxID=121620 RepID=A0A8J3LCJ7_9ACTN|nr:hypothetical protein [Catellatospora methionotrophica]GIG18402.1 hypothetical protein Cme02nite_67340 [Catellatospora methionotrophica]